MPFVVNDIWEQVMSCFKAIIIIIRRNEVIYYKHLKMYLIMTCLYVVLESSGLQLVLFSLSDNELFYNSINNENNMKRDEVIYYKYTKKCTSLIT